MSKYNDILSDIVHVATQAMLCDDDNVRRVALGDIAAALASILPVDHAERTVAPSRQGAPHYLDFCGMQMAALGGPGQSTTIIGKRAFANPTNPVQIFEIKVHRRNGIYGCVAKCTENDELLFTLESEVRFDLTKVMAVKCLRALLTERTKTNARHHRQEKRKRRAAALSPSAELAATVARQQDDEDLAQRIENA